VWNIHSITVPQIITNPRSIMYSCGMFLPPTASWPASCSPMFNIYDTDPVSINKLLQALYGTLVTCATPRASATPILVQF